MFLRLGCFIQRHARLVIVLWSLVVLASLPLAPRLPGILRPGGFASDQLEAAQAQRLAEQRLGRHGNSLAVVFRSADLSADQPRFQAAVERTITSLKALPGVTGVISPLINPRQVSADGHTAYAVVTLDAQSDRSRDAFAQVQALLRDYDGVSVLASGASVFYADIENVSARDLRRAELIALPLGLIALLLVTRSLLAAAVPILVGGAGVASALALLFLLGHVADFSIFVMNMSTMLGLGLSIDYALFVTSRFREQLECDDPAQAVITTVATAGRAVFFSALTVLTGLLGLMTFDTMLLRSVGLAGVVVVALAALAAMTLLPAVLAVLGQRVNAFPLPALPVPGSFSWSGFATIVMRHPIRVSVPVLVFLIVLGSPFLGVRLSAPDANILPADTPSRRGIEILHREFGEGELSPIMLVVRSQGSIMRPDNLARLYDYTHALAQDERVARVESIAHLDPRLTKEQHLLLYSDPDHITDPYAAAMATELARDDTTLVAVASKFPMVSDETLALVRDLRLQRQAAGFDIMVGGASASIVDYVASLYSDAPRAVAIVVLVTYAALFLLFRSVVLPLKAIVMNTFSILASYGALVVVFQEGHLSGLLGFTPAGFVEASLPIVMFCFLFGVSMDYEVFLLSRIKEAYDRHGDNARSVAEGLERSGRVITGAALIVVVVAASFVTADIILIKALGLGTAIAVFLDATIVRVALVPATMRLLGRLNWWLPQRPLFSYLGLGAGLTRYAAVVLALGVVGAGLLSLLPVGTPRELAAGKALLEPQASLPKSLPPLVLPDDEMPHDALTEWWYYTGHLADSGGQRYGFEFVIFQSRRQGAPVGYASHFAVTDHARRAFHYDQRRTIANRAAPQEGLSLRVGDWQLEASDGHDRLSAEMPGYSLRLELQATKPPALHLGDGIISFGAAGDSYYYSRTRMDARGTIEVEGTPAAVSGNAWMDHQWGDFLVLNEGGWDWFAFQLDDGSDLTLSTVRAAGGEVLLRYGTYVNRDGSAHHLADADLALSEIGTWTSPRTGARYPAAWVVDVPSRGLSLSVTPVLADQELDTRASTGNIYWEGEVAVAGHSKGAPIAGHGYVELTGYAAP